MTIALNIGVTHQSITDPEKLADPATKHYSCRYPGQTVICGDGSEAPFVGGTFSTQDPYLINILDKQAGYPGSMIYAGRKDLPELTTVAQAAQDNATLAKVAASADAGKPADPATLENAGKVVEAMKTK